MNRLEHKTRPSFKGEIISYHKKLKFFKFLLPEKLESGDMIYTMKHSPSNKEGVRMPFLAVTGHMYYKLQVSLIEPHFWSLRCNIPQEEANLYIKSTNKKRLYYDKELGTITTYFKSRLSPHLFYDILDYKLDARLKEMITSPYFHNWQQKLTKKLSRCENYVTARHAMITRQREAGVIYNLTDCLSLGTRPLCYADNVMKDVIQQLRQNYQLVRAELVANRPELWGCLGSDKEQFIRYKTKESVALENTRILNFLFCNVQVAARGLRGHDDVENHLGFKRWDIHEMVSFMEARGQTFPFGDLHNYREDPELLIKQVRGSLYLIDPSNVYCKANMVKMGVRHMTTRYTRLLNREIKPNQLVKVGRVPESILGVNKKGIR